MIMTMAEGGGETIETTMEMEPVEAPPVEAPVEIPVEVPEDVAESPQVPTPSDSAEPVDQQAEGTSPDQDEGGATQPTEKESAKDEAEEKPEVTAEDLKKIASRKQEIVDKLIEAGFETEESGQELIKKPLKELEADEKALFSIRPEIEVAEKTAFLKLAFPELTADEINLHANSNDITLDELRKVQSNKELTSKVPEDKQSQEGMAEFLAEQHEEEGMNPEEAKNKADEEVALWKKLLEEASDDFWLAMGQSDLKTFLDNFFGDAYVNDRMDKARSKETSGEVKSEYLFKELMENGSFNKKKVAASLNYIINDQNSFNIKLAWQNSQEGESELKKGLKQVNYWIENDTSSDPYWKTKINVGLSKFYTRGQDGSRTFSKKIVGEQYRKFHYEFNSEFGRTLYNSKKEEGSKPVATKAEAKAA